VDWRNEGMEKWRNGGKEKWKKGETVECWNDGMME